jgi:hypothetical protein
MAPAAGRRSGALCLSGPWLDRSAADHLLVSLPYSMGMRLERCELSNRPLDSLGWYRSGLRLAMRGSALEQVLDQSGADLLAANRIHCSEQL